jgi:hypothetical protein
MNFAKRRSDARAGQCLFLRESCDLLRYSLRAPCFALKFRRREFHPPQNLSICHCARSRHAEGLTCEASFAEKIATPYQRDLPQLHENLAWLVPQSSTMAPLAHPRMGHLGRIGRCAREWHNDAKGQLRGLRLGKPAPSKEQSAPTNG